MEHIDNIVNDLLEQLDHYEVAASDLAYMNQPKESKSCGEKAALLRMWHERLSKYADDFRKEYENA